MGSNEENRDSYQDKYLNERFRMIHSELQHSNKLNAQQHTEIKGHLEQLQSKLEQVHSEQKETNGRVTKLELQTTLARKIQQKPILLVLSLLILSIVVDLFTNAELKEWIINIFS